MNRKHKALIIGVGSIGERHLRCFQSTNRCDVALCEINPTLREDVTSRYNISPSFASLDDALTHHDHHFDLAVVATPAHTHIPIARRLARADIHMLIEKPLSTTMHDVDALCEEVQPRNLIAAVAYVWRANPIVTAMKRALDAQRFGQPVQLKIVTGQHFPTYRPAYRDIYYAKREQGGGAIQDALTHMMNLGEWLVGPIDRLVADADHLVLDGVEVEDTVHLIARHGRVMASYTLNQHQAPNETTITVCCTAGTCRAVTHENRWQWMTQPASEWRIESFAPLERDTLFVTQAHAFLDAVEGKSPPLCSLQEGAQTLRANLAALKSADDASTFVKINEAT